ncbi:hypothetical protein PYW07_006561 [Mythimna separata]|uniref:Uncharacterized protein n=1 Tax=Mythimna separata TaxID=271217 RepID=A0AAD7YWY4_MYTSE|nr:hypothetical protein PYW07_006561 [Mythimna separata]
MVALRKAIEAGLSCTVRDRVWDNPRFLVSSGNTPAIMQVALQPIATRHGGAAEGDRSGALVHGARQSVGQPALPGQQRQHARYHAGSFTTYVCMLPATAPQDMVALRKAIEAGLSCTVRDRVWDNPRFLVSSGNTPAIMQVALQPMCVCYRPQRHKTWWRCGRR